MIQWLHNDLPSLLSAYGYGAVVVLLVLESIGFPIPGSTVLVAASIYAGATQTLDIGGVIIAASIGAVIGDNIAYWLGRKTGYSLIKRYGCYSGLAERKLKLGRYLFRLHGGKIVFFARFIAFLRVLTMYLAGINRMAWHRFVVVNAAGSVAWALVFGGGGYLLGQQAHRVTELVSIALLALSVLALAGAFIFIRGHLARLSAEAELEFPEPLRD